MAGKKILTPTHTYTHTVSLLRYHENGIVERYLYQSVEDIWDGREGSRSYEMVGSHKIMAFHRKKRRAKRAVTNCFAIFKISFVPFPMEIMLKLLKLKPYNYYSLISLIYVMKANAHSVENLKDIMFSVLTH